MTRIIILGASTDATKYSNKALRAYLSRGYEVIPVNPKYDEVWGLKCYKSLSEVSQADIISVYLPPETGLKISAQIIRLKPELVYLNPGSESPELIKVLESNKIKVKTECSIRALGINPDDL